MLPKAVAMGTANKLIPLPIYATLPQEGDTWGFLPVFLTVENDTQRTQQIIAPSISWNKIIRYTTTFRWYYYPSDEQSITLIPSISTNVNRGVLFQYFHQPQNAGRWTTDVELRVLRSLFFRFFGLGPDTPADAESSYTRLGGYATIRTGYNLSPVFNVGAKITYDRQIIEAEGVSFLPLATEKFSGTPGMAGDSTLFEGISLRYDSRNAREYSTKGLASEFILGTGQGLYASNSYQRANWDTRLLWPELKFASGAAHFFWSYTWGDNVPFFEQSSLGGSYRLRGFTEDRFVDKGAWLIELEQRIALFTTHIYGVDADWRIDPFVAAGQVYNDATGITNHVRYSAGLGFRAFVRPNVLGRVDTAVGGEGLKIYVELGYPF